MAFHLSLVFSLLNPKFLRIHAHLLRLTQDVNTFMKQRLISQLELLHLSLNFYSSDYLQPCVCVCLLHTLAWVCVSALLPGGATEARSTPLPKYSATCTDLTISFDWRGMKEANDKQMSKNQRQNPTKSKIKQGFWPVTNRKPGSLSCIFYRWLLFHILE